jgi:uncharacterized protein YndB with AHSA1/START domain
LFAAFADPARLTNWWGPDGFTSDIQTFEFRPGGKWLMTLIGPDGIRYPNESAFLENIPDQKVVFSHDCEPYFIMTMTYEPKGTNTLLSWWMVFVSASVRDKVARYCISGNEQNYDRLAAYLLTTGRKT